MKEKLTIEKKLKALKIIKEKQVSVHEFVYSCKCPKKELKQIFNVDTNYELACGCVGFDKEKLKEWEYELLKEVLYNMENK